MSTTFRKNQVNDIFDNELKFGSTFIIANVSIKYPQPLLKFLLNKLKKVCVTLLWPNIPP